MFRCRFVEMANAFAELWVKFPNYMEMLCLLWSNVFN